jgi:AcrR family transcriptional regulator
MTELYWELQSPTKMAAKSMNSGGKPRLTREDWFRTGLEALAKSGPGAVKAVKLARMLGVTTGSFYWHFSSLGEFRAGLLEYWKEDVVVGLIRAAKSSAQEPAQVLVELRKRILESGAHRYDAALRRLAATDPRVRDAVSEADEVRATFLMEMLCKSGMSEDEARDRANLIGAAWRGSVDLEDPDYRMKLIRLAAQG